jgi:hypothetical protein
LAFDPGSPIAVMAKPDPAGISRPFQDIPAQA